MIASCCRCNDLIQVGRIAVDGRLTWLRMLFTTRRFHVEEGAVGSITLKNRRWRLLKIERIEAVILAQEGCRLKWRALCKASIF